MLPVDPWGDSDFVETTPAVDQPAVARKKTQLRIVLLAALVFVGFLIVKKRKG